jgi:hypothetical protein
MVKLLIVAISAQNELDGDSGPSLPVHAEKSDGADHRRINFLFLWVLERTEGRKSGLERAKYSAAQRSAARKMPALPARCGA